MTDHPILFSGAMVSGAMVRAILDGRKTQTRRVVKPMPGKQRKWLNDARLNIVPSVRMATAGGRNGVALEHPKGGPGGWIACPYGTPGDRLWVRETWGYRGSSWVSSAPNTVDLDIEYQADLHRETFHDVPMSVRDHLTTHRPRLESESDDERHEYLTRYWRSWRPSIHMPRWASRILLDVVGVRVERLQAIAARDVEAEGVEIDRERVARMHQLSGVDPEDNVRASFACLWDTINGHRAPWESNPWVWAIEFKRAE